MFYAQHMAINNIILYAIKLIKIPLITGYTILTVLYTND